MKTNGFVRTLALVLAISTLVLPMTGCFGADKDSNASDFNFFGVLFGGYWGVGLAFGFFLQEAPQAPQPRLTLEVDGEFEGRALNPVADESAIAYVDDHDLTLVLVHDADNDVIFEMAIPGNTSGRYELPAGELSAPWFSLEVEGDRFSTSERASVVVEVKNEQDSIMGEFRGQVEGAGGSLVDVSGSFEGTIVR